MEQPRPAGVHARLFLLLVAAALVGVLFWNSWPLYPLKLLVVLMHESGHAFATLLVGGAVDAIRVSPDEGGVTFSRFAPTLLSRVVVSSAGYVGSTVSGCVLLLAAARAREGRLPLYALAGWTAGVAVLWVRDLFTLGFTLACTLVLFALARFAPSGLRRGALAFLASFSVLYAFFDIQDDLFHLRSASGRTDADALASATFIPAIVWGLGWAALSVALVVVTLRFVARPSPVAAREQLLADAGKS